MQTMLYYFYNEIDRDKGPTCQKLYIGTVEEAIGWCLKVKDNQKVTPVGFSIITFDEDDNGEVEIIDENKYYLNGKIITKKNIPYNWEYRRMFKEHEQLVLIGEDFCYPFDEETDTILHINI